MKKIVTVKYELDKEDYELINKHINDIKPCDKCSLVDKCGMICSKSDDYYADREELTPELEEVMDLVLNYQHEFREVYTELNNKAKALLDKGIDVSKFNIKSNL